MDQATVIHLSHFAHLFTPQEEDAQAPSLRAPFSKTDAVPVEKGEKRGDR